MFLELFEVLDFVLVDDLVSPDTYPVEEGSLVVGRWHCCWLPEKIGFLVIWRKIRLISMVDVGEN